MLKALVADDDLIYRHFFSSVLRQLDFSVVAEADNGQKAVDLEVQYDPDLVLLDIMMPGLNGFLALEEISVRVPNTFIIMHTAIDDEEVKSRCRLAGAQDYIVKAGHLKLTAEKIIKHVRFLRTRPFNRVLPTITKS